jgi:hypothetical protein
MIAAPGWTAQEPSGFSVRSNGDAAGSGRREPVKDLATEGRSEGYGSMTTNQQLDAVTPSGAQE